MLPLLLIPIVAGLVGVAATAVAVSGSDNSNTYNAKPDPDPEEVKRKREREKLRNSYKRDRAQILKGFAAQHEVRISDDDIAKLSVKGAPHRELLEKAVKRKTAELLRIPKSERETREVMLRLAGEIKQLQGIVENQITEIQEGNGYE